MPSPNFEDALRFTIEYIRSGLGKRHSMRDYGYDVWAPNVASRWVSLQNQGRNDDGLARQLSPKFYEAVWETLSKRYPKTRGSGVPGPRSR
jgi:hypothetical protein